MLYLIKSNENVLKYVDLGKKNKMTNLMRNEIIYIWPCDFRE